MVDEKPHLLQPDEHLDADNRSDHRVVELGQTYADTELVFGLVGAVGTELKQVVTILTERLQVAGYNVTEVRVSKDIIAKLIERKTKPAKEYERIYAAMDDGDTARRESQDNSVLALGAAGAISSSREKYPDGRRKHSPRAAYIINSLKHPDEVNRLREIYPLGFYLIGVHADRGRRFKFLKEEGLMSAKQANRLMARDEKEKEKYGQQLTDTFHLADFFVRLDDYSDRLKYSVWRIIGIIFGDPYKTPTFDEYAMFLAFATSLRSADLSRQVGAVIAKGKEIIASGTNDCPQFGGGLYWPEYKDDIQKIEDAPKGRDYMRGKDPNKAEQQEIINEIITSADKTLDKRLLREVLEESGIKYLTEFGRIVHAEMEAILACGRIGNSAAGATLYCTTLPCHNCAKHIIAAGITRVVFIEPYEKSQAEKLHKDAMVVGFSKRKNVVRFEPFVGVGPRRFLDLFSMRLGSGYPLRRKDEKSKTLTWHLRNARARLEMLPCTYLDLELVAGEMFKEFRESRLKEKDDGTKDVSTN
jgi:deoxycytidylate deaminase